MRRRIACGPRSGPRRAAGQAQAAVNLQPARGEAAVTAPKNSGLRRQSIGQLVDRLGEVRAQVTALQHEDREIKSEILRRRVGEADGAKFRFALVSAVRWTLNVAAVKAEMGEEWVERRSKMATVVSARVLPRAEALASAAPIAEAA